MEDNDCVRFLQWALPQLGMRWGGFRKVRKRVCKRISHRLEGLALGNITAYQERLRQDPEEWYHLDTLCRVVVTSFYRDRRVFQAVTDNILPQLAAGAIAAGRDQIRAWSIGGASGEEAYSLAIIWQQQLSSRFPQLELAITTTEIDAYLIERGRYACYEWAAIKNLPEALREAAFIQENERYCLRPDFKRKVEFLQQDVRTTLPMGRFDLIFCRNLVFTYFDESQQRTVLQGIVSRLNDGGWLVLGMHEQLPHDAAAGLQVVSEQLGLYRR